MASAFWAVEGVPQHGPSHYWVAFVPLPWSRCIGTMSGAEGSDSGGPVLPELPSNTQPHTQSRWSTHFCEEKDNIARGHLSGTSSSLCSLPCSDPMKSPFFVLHQLSAKREDHSARVTHTFTPVRVTGTTF